MELTGVDEALGFINPSKDGQWVFTDEKYVSTDYNGRPILRMVRQYESGEYYIGFIKMNSDGTPFLHDGVLHLYKCTPVERVIMEYKID